MTNRLPKPIIITLFHHRDAKAMRRGVADAQLDDYSGDDGPLLPVRQTRDSLGEGGSVNTVRARLPPVRFLPICLDDGEGGAVWLRRAIWFGIAWITFLFYPLVFLPLRFFEGSGGSSSSSSSSSELDPSSSGEAGEADPHFGVSAPVRYFLLFLVHVLSLVTCWSYWVATHTGPGEGTPRDWLPEGLDWTRDLDVLTEAKRAIAVKSHIRYNYHWKLRWCEHCEKFKSPRTHHCRVCDKCCPRMDHHCPAVGQCIGLRNHKVFLQFLFYVNVGCVVLASVLIWMWDKAAKEDLYTPALWALFAFAWVTFFLVILKTGILFAEHVRFSFFLRFCCCVVCDSPPTR
jgi:DHHC palmitoyltransferase